MRPRDLATLLAHAIPARLPILVTGAPAIGKSDIVRQASEAAGADLIISHPVVADPTDAKGLPWPDTDKRSATFLPFGDLARAIASTKPTVWLLDDLGQASPAVQASFMQLLLARRVNDHVLPDCVTFIAATNRRTDRAGVSGILEPVKSRFAAIVPLEVNLDDWADWYIKTDGSPELLAFLRFKPALLHVFEPTADLTNGPSPRTWVAASKFIGMGLSKDIELAAIQGAVGAGAAAEFVGFLRVYRDLPTLASIIDDPDHAMIPPKLNPSARYAVTTGLASMATVANLPSVLRYAERMYKEAEGGEFAALMLRDMHRRDQTLAHTQSWLKMILGPLGHLISGKDFEEPAPAASVRKRR